MYIDTQKKPRDKPVLLSDFKDTYAASEKLVGSWTKLLSLQQPVESSKTSLYYLLAPIESRLDYVKR